jgi:hypothetical protein
MPLRYPALLILDELKDFAYDNEYGHNPERLFFPRTCSYLLAISADGILPY